jgi:hypothetical protein
MNVPVYDYLVWPDRYYTVQRGSKEWPYKFKRPSQALLDQIVEGEGGRLINLVVYMGGLH